MRTTGNYWRNCMTWKVKYSRSIPNRNCFAIENRCNYTHKLIIRRGEREKQGEYRETPQYDYVAQARYRKNCTLHERYLRLACTTWLCTVCMNLLSPFSHWCYKTLTPCSRDMKTLFSDAIEFLNNTGDIHKTFADVKENNVDPSQLVQDLVKYWKLFKTLER